MKTARELYPNDIDTYNYPVSYDDIVAEFGKVLVRVDDLAWQGDSLVLLEGTGGAVGYLEFGWGSCSCCDALEACCSYEDLDELMVEMFASIRWFSKEEALCFIIEHDWVGSHLSNDLYSEFILKAKEVLTQQTGGTTP